jgi:hypothetical protein
MRLLTSLVRLPNRERIVKALACALAISAICWFFGANVWQALMLGCGITILISVGLIGTAPEVRDLRWRGTANGRSRGSRSDVASLAFRLHGSWGQIDYSVQRRARDLARRRLAIEGLDLQNVDHRPQIEQLIGTDSYDFLMRSQKTPPRLRTLLHCLDSLDAIDPVAYSRHVSQSEGRFPFLTQLRQRRTRDR